MKNCLNCQYGHPVEKYFGNGHFEYCYECRKGDCKQYFHKPVQNCKEHKQRRFV